jgi:aminoglycoside 3-N-acetyltransferase
MNTWRDKLRRHAKPLVRAVRRAAARTFHGHGSAELDRALATVGLTAGDTVMVHSGFRAASGFTGTPSDVIACLERAIAPDGNLLMMAMPYRGATEAYAARDPLFDARRSPAATGIIAETFRRRADVRRSLSPFHPVLAAGPLAVWLTADHERTPYTCGRGTPFERLLELDGRLLFYDAPYSAMTFMHYVEDRCRDDLPVALYGEEPVLVRVRDAAGRERSVRQYYFSAAARERRHFAPIEALLETRGQLRRARAGNSQLLCVDARDVLAAATSLLADGRGFYR